VLRDKPVARPAKGTRKCNCRSKVVTRQLGPGMFQQFQQQECQECANVAYARETEALSVAVEPGMTDRQARRRPGARPGPRAFHSPHRAAACSAERTGAHGDAFIKAGAEPQAAARAPRHARGARPPRCSRMVLKGSVSMSLLGRTGGGIL